MKIIALLLLFVITTSNALAQSQQNNAGDRIAFQIGRMLLQIEQQQDQLSAQQLQLTQAQSEIKRLKEKYEPADKEKKE